MQMEMMFERSDLDARNKPTALKLAGSAVRRVPKKAAAIDVVDQTLRDCLPPGVPPSFVKILSATTTGTGRNETISAKLSMVDGTVATVRLKRWAMGWSHQYMDLPGGALFWDGERWVHDTINTSGCDTCNGSGKEARHQLCRDCDENATPNTIGERSCES